MNGLFTVFIPDAKKEKSLLSLKQADLSSMLHALANQPIAYP